MADETQVDAWKENSDFRKILKMIEKGLEKRASEMARGCLASGEIDNAMLDYLMSLIG
jgi:hypothetical protein